MMKGHECSYDVKIKHAKPTQIYVEPKPSNDIYN